MDVVAHGDGGSIAQRLDAGDLDISWPEFGSGGAEMGVYDVNGDGLNDVVTVLPRTDGGSPGLNRSATPRASSHSCSTTSGDFSTKNAGNVTFFRAPRRTFADLDGDGIPDFIVGKRVFSHLESYLDPDPYGPAVLYWYRTAQPESRRRSRIVPELIHNRSGVGSHLAAVGRE